MNKTGSSAIQRALKGYKTDHVIYAHMGDPNPYNHSLPLRTVFRTAQEGGGGGAKYGWSQADMARLKAGWEQGFERMLTGVDGRDVIFSAEYLSGNSITPELVTRIKDRLRPHFDDIRVIAYVRPPVGYMQSLFQQHVKGGQRELVPARLYPQYRQRFEPWIEVFGRTAVELIKFDRETLVGGNAVLDFTHRIGLDMTGRKLADANPSMSLEVMATLYAQRKLGAGFVAFPGAPKKNLELIDALAPLGQTRLTFAPELVEPVLRHNARDMTWIEKQLGAPIRDYVTEAPDAITSEADLLAVAAGKSGHLGLILRKIGFPGKQLAALEAQKQGAERVAAFVDLWREYINAGRPDFGPAPAQPASSRLSRSVGRLLRNLGVAEDRLSRIRAEPSTLRRMKILAGTLKK
ncbi:MAG: hypothetical protein GY949_23480 [Gammaproteobacteria bacterium]|nr:hypothetical protein [Gammaproteobacteria bacterium]